MSSEYSIYEPFWSHYVRRWQLQRGDHLYVWSSALHHHHGIYIGGDRVIHVFGHNKQSSCIQQCTMSQFAAGRKIRRSRYGRPWWEVLLKAPGTCYPFPRDAGNIVADRALQRLAQASAQPETHQWKYHIYRSNCETFCLQLTSPSYQTGSHQAQQLYLRYNPLATIYSGIRARLDHYQHRARDSSSTWFAWLFQSEERRRVLAAQERFFRRVRGRFSTLRLGLNRFRIFRIRR